MINLRILSLLALAACGSVALGQRVSVQAGQGVMVSSGSFGSPLGLLSRKDVQNDLQLTAGQMAKVSELQSTFGPRSGGFSISAGAVAGAGPVTTRPDPEEMAARQAEEKQAVASILSKAQGKRLDEINVQIQGNMSVMDPEVQKALGVSDDQKDRIQSAIESVHESMGPITFSSDGPPDAHQIEAHIKQMQDSLNSAVGALLTPAQKAALKRMGGAPFKRVDPPIIVRTGWSG